VVMGPLGMVSAVRKAIRETLETATAVSVTRLRGKVASCPILDVKICFKVVIE